MPENKLRDRIKELEDINKLLMEELKAKDHKIVESVYQLVKSEKMYEEIRKDLENDELKESVLGLVKSDR